MITLKQKIFELDGDVETVISLFLNRVGQRDGILLESAEVDGRWGRYSLAAGDFLLLARNCGGKLALDINDARLSPLAEFAGLPYLDGLRKVMDSVAIVPAGSADFPPITRAMYGYLDYEAAAGAAPDKGAEGGFCLAGNVYLFDHSYNRLTRLGLIGDAADKPPAPGQREAAPVKIGPEKALLSRDEYLAATEKLRRAMRETGSSRAVLSSRASAGFSGDLFEVYRSLRRLYPSPYMFYMNFPEISLALSSPELLISCGRGKLCVKPTTTEGPDENLFEEEPRPEEEAAHSRLVAAARADLSAIAAPDTVRVERYMESERASGALRLTSLVTAELGAGRHPLDVLAAAFPPASTSGLPKARAVEILAECEGAPRGPYGGAMGWLGLDKDVASLDLGVTLRCLWRRDGRVFWQGGTSVAPNTDPRLAWEDCQKNLNLTRAALLAAAGGKALPQERAEDAAPKTAAPKKAADPTASPFPVSVIMEQLAGGEDLSEDMAAQLFGRLMDGELSPAQAGALLMGLRAKGETPLEMAEAAKAVLARAVPLPPLTPFGETLLDIVGTGGDGRNSFNCSTAASLVMAGLGHPVVKHGNRSVSSRCGSADVLELLGINLNAPPETVPRSLREKSFAFLFAPNYHPSFRHVMPVRKELGIRALFNILGPLVNPARPAHSFLGAPNPLVLPLLAGALASLGTVFSAVITGAGGYDEMTTIGPAKVLLVEGDKITETSIDPARYGFAPCGENELAINGPEEGVRVLRELLAGRGPRAMRDMLIINVAMALYVKSGAGDFGRCVREARQAVGDGAGLKAL